ncbi:winged helix-turn-helix transcriptional regulator [Actinacidiphila acidipaludis]|uniref:Helix-turn-helix transcriptional regulator n=1 Tax=Actinacidiphila acidipaludis TaxID=2873382 RepID=A0ABS7Q2I7_9ACTN|nr:helix-turn-helix domain-containing protein [Streptomyces acidipaludis]MBY8877358.1 helix-turn-helix transcriptional regulator [Streptomyces acidipaludis]
MKSYHQYCSVARALDVVGDRWVLLIVRELLALGPSRYTDLKGGLPGIATNLLADRLRSMEASGLVERYEAPPPVGTTLFRLTDRGRELQDVIGALARWGLDLMAPGPDPADAVQPHWTALAGALLLPGRLGPGAEVVVGIESEDETLHMTLRPGAFAIGRGAAPAADVTLTGTAMLVGAVLSGLLTPQEAVGRGLRVDDPRNVLPTLVGAAADTTA